MEQFPFLRKENYLYLMTFDSSCKQCLQPIKLSSDFGEIFAKFQKFLTVELQKLSLLRE